MRIEEAVTKAWSSVLTQQILAAVMGYLQQLGDNSLLSGEDSGLENVWEEICVQVQLEESIFWDAYLETIEQAIGARVNELERTELLALWSTTDSGWDWIYDHHGDKDGDQEAPVDPSEIISALRGKLLAMAADDTNSNISRFHALHYGYDYYEVEEDDEGDEDEDDGEEAEDDYPINAQDQDSKAELAQPVVNDQLTTEPVPLEDSKIVEPDQSAFVRPSDYGKNNKIFTEDAYLAARERLRKKLAQLNAEIDPETLQAGMTLDQARADLADLEQRLKDQGPVTDARLKDKVREYRKLVSAMEAKQTGPVEKDRLKAEGQRQGDTNAEPPATPSAEEMADLRVQMGQAIAELAALLGAKTNLSGEEENRFLPVMSKIFRIAAKMSYIRFKDVGRNVMQRSTNWPATRSSAKTVMMRFHMKIAS